MDLQETYIEKIPEIIRRIVSTSNPAQIILFGSFARGDFDRHSDLDLLVVIEGVTEPRAESIRIRRALRGLLVPVDIVVTSPEWLDLYENRSGWVYKEALKEGKVVYERPIAA